MEDEWKEEREGRVKDDRKAGAGRKGRIEDERKAERRRQNEG